ncbi:hypothetical protein BGZ80_010005 [Entomortierella chlamydospora]|uniref:Crinkler effector protein N-terminal domain-containing protein n=1 Tax=Entomortierella chlamydospora TaxID=101097 RepID=A0A9P6MVH7_9FUNG|nr:hypothetical protein BGZ80_010005 [Entomortierella chlamydospora]
MASKAEFLRTTTALKLHNVMDTFVQMFHIDTAEELLGVLSTTLQEVQSEDNGEALNKRFTCWSQEIETKKFKRMAARYFQNRATIATASVNPPAAVTASVNPSAATAATSTNPATAALIIFCIVSGEKASNAFPIKIPSSETIGEFKKAVKREKPSAFTNIEASDLVIWRVSIFIDEEADDETITTNSIDSKKLLKATSLLSNAFNDGVPRDTIHIIIERPKVQVTQAVESDKRIAELLEEIDDLRGGKSTVAFNVIVRPNRSEYFPWTTDLETTSVKELTESIYIEYPEREEGDVTLAIVHPRRMPQYEGGGTERLKDDQHLRSVIKQYLKANMRTLVVSLEIPTKKFTDFTLVEVNNMYGMSHLEAPSILDLPAFEGISSEAFGSDLHKESLKRLLDELDSRIKAIPHTDNEAACSAYVCSFLTQAVQIFEGALTVAPERPLHGRHGHGKVDYSIEASVNGMTHIVGGVTEVKQDDFKKGVAQNIVQLESSLTIRKRKLEEGGDDVDEDKSIPMKSYGIVTNAVYWYFLECTIDPSSDVPASDPNRPRFRISQLDEIINYRKDRWREDAEAVLGQIVWLLRKMISEIPNRELRHKRQKTDAGGVGPASKI